MHIVSARNITKSFDGNTVLDKVSIEVPTAGIYGLLGPNGAGKTTFLRILNKILIPDSGQLFFKDEPYTLVNLHSIGYLPEERGLYKKMKVGEQCLYLARLKGMSGHEAKQKLNDWFEKFNLQSWWTKRVEELSKGMQQKVQFITTIMHDPDLLILDEPFSGFDPVNASLIKTELLNYRQMGKTIILSTHNMNSVEELCDEITLIDHGKVLLQGNVQMIKKSCSKNIIEICCRGNIPDQLLPTIDGCRVLHSVTNSESFTIVINVIDGEHGNRLLQLYAEKFQVLSFKILLPSMNEIFIDAVKAGNKSSDYGTE